MNPQRFFQLLLLFGTAVAMTATCLFFKHYPIGSADSSLVSQNVNEYLGPKQRTSGNQQLVRVQILVNDDPSPQGVQIESVTFHKKNVSLKPRDIYGFRGEASYQVPAGTYLLKWTVRRDRTIWPRTISHEEEVNVDPRDYWIQITIKGETAEIS